MVQRRQIFLVERREVELGPVRARVAERLLARHGDVDQLSEAGRLVVGEDLLHVGVDVVHVHYDLLEGGSGINYCKILGDTYSNRCVGDDLESSGNCT